MAALVALTAIAALAATTIATRRSAAARREMRLDIATPPTIDPFSLAIAPDGQKRRLRRHGRWCAAVVAAPPGHRLHQGAEEHRRWISSILVAGQPVDRICRERSAQTHRPRERVGAQAGERAAVPRRHLEPRRPHPVRAEHELACVPHSGGRPGEAHRRHAEDRRGQPVGSVRPARDRSVSFLRERQRRNCAASMSPTPMGRMCSGCSTRTHPRSMRRRATSCSN